MVLIAAALAAIAAAGLVLIGWATGWPPWTRPALFGGFSIGGLVIVPAAAAGAAAATALAVTAVGIGIAGLAWALNSRQRRPRARPTLDRIARQRRWRRFEREFWRSVLADGEGSARRRDRKP